MELKDDASTSTHERLKFIADHVDVKLGDIKLLIPILIQLFRLYQVSQLHVLEALDLVLFCKLVLQECAEGGLAHTRGTSDQNVRKARLHLLRGSFHYLIII